MTSGQKTAVNLGLLLLSSLFSLLILEQGFRIFLFGAKAFNMQALRNNVPINNAGIMQQSPFDDIYWEMKPLLDTSLKMARLTTNSAGLADQEYSRPKPAGTFRIAVLGDSYSMASGVDTDKSYHALLEQRLNQSRQTQSSQKQYELINFSIGGFGLERYNAMLQYKVPEWQPDAILLGYCGFNDHIALPPKTGHVPLFNPPRFNGFWMSYIHAYFDMKRAEKTAGPQTLNTNNLAFIDNELAHMRTLANWIKPGMPIVLTYLDNREHSAQDLQQLEKIATAHQMAFVDASHRFVGTNLDAFSINMLDSHPNENANHIFYQQLFSAINKNHWFDFQETPTP